MLNKAILVGRLTADPELRQTTSGVPVCTFSIAIDRPYQSGGERTTDFIDIVTWRATAEFVYRYFGKGSAIGVDGAIQVRNYTDKNGNKRRAFEVVAASVSFVERRSTDSAQQVAVSKQPETTLASGDIGDFQVIESDEDLPF